MITKNPMQLKALIKKKAAEKNISAQLVMQNYMLERLLERISLSKYKYNFILKGGFLISAIVGLDTRATMDLDTTIKGFTLTHESIRNIFAEICAIGVADDVTFEITDISDIREGDDYPGIRVGLKANYAPISVPLTVDVTTGDIITPREIEYTFSLLLDDRSISVLAYDLECLSLLWKQNGGINVLSEMRKELSADEAGFRELTDPMLYKLSSVFSGDYVKPARYPRFDE